MRKSWFSRLGVAATVGWLSVSGATATGCASQQAPIDQVQVGYVKKSDLIGLDPSNPTQWYFRNAVVDTASSNAFTFPGEEGELMRIRWDIQQNWLLARLAYEVVSGSDGKGANPAINDGIIVAAFPIKSQFDIENAYNAATGEQYNILTENTTDRPWYERDYVRVDWSQNVMPNDQDIWPFWLAHINWDADASITPLAYYETDPLSPNHPEFDFDTGYFDITAKYLFTTPNITIEGFTLPSCLLINLYTGSQTADCNAQEVTVRSAFMKVPTDRDYEPLETDVSQWSMFGTFDRDRWGYDRSYQVTDASWHRFVGRFNTWQKSHTATACGGDDVKATADALCAAATPNSVCDMNNKLCTIPYEQRTVRTNTYFVSQAMPADLYDQNAALVSEWNTAIMTSIGYARELECRASGTDQATCHAKYFDATDAPVASNGPALVLCHNPVIDADDHTNCGATGLRARNGDLRYSLIDWVDPPAAAGPLGLATDGTDPLTGEIIQAGVHIYGAALDTYAAMTRDLVALADGDLDPQDYVNGSAEQSNLGSYAPSRSTALTPLFADLGKLMAGEANRGFGNIASAQELNDRLKGIDTSRIVASIGADVSQGGGASDRLDAVNAAITTQSTAGVSGFGGNTEFQARVDSLAARAAGTGVESAIENSEYLVDNAMPGVTSVSDMTTMASPLSGLNPTRMTALKKNLEQTLEQAGICHYGASEFDAPHFLGLAKVLFGKYKSQDPTTRANSVFTDLRGYIYKAVTEHELGHNMGLRHNFAGSWDALNYHPNYWALRTQSGAQIGVCTTPRAAGAPDNCMGPRWLDPVTDEELGDGLNGAGTHPGIDEFSYSSIMDYGYDFNSDLHGIGQYDKAAIKFIYGGLVETFDATSSAGVAKDVAPVLSADITEQWMVNRSDPAIPGGKQVQPTHYTTLARLLQTSGVKLYDPTRCHAAVSDQDNWDAITGGQTCAPIPKDHSFVRNMTSGVTSDIPNINADANYWYNPTTKQIRWPYRFGTDDYAYYPHIQRFDAGADVYEASVQATNLYEYRYVLDFFRRGRRGWFTFFFTDRLWSRYFSRFKTYGWLSAFRTSEYAAMYPTDTATTNPVLQSDDWGRGYALASTFLFDTLARSMTRPQPGMYAKDSGDLNHTNANINDPSELYELFDTGTQLAFSDTVKPAFSIGVLDGRYVDEVYDNDTGGSFEYLSYLERMGTYVEKPLAALALTGVWPAIDVTTRETYTDGRNMLLNFRSVMPQAYDRLYAGTLSGDADTIAPWVTPTGDTFTTTSTPTYFSYWAPTLTRPAGVSRVQPLVGYLLQSQQLLYSLWLGNYDGNLDIANSVRVWVEGGPEAINVPQSEKIFFFEPESGLTYAARSVGQEVIDGKNVEIGPGARILQRANAILAQAYTVQTAQGSDGISYPIYDSNGVVQWQAAAPPATVLDASQVATFKRYVGLIQTERLFLQYFGN